MRDALMKNLFMNSGCHIGRPEPTYERRPGHRAGHLPKCPGRSGYENTCNGGKSGEKDRIVNQVLDLIKEHYRFVARDEISESFVARLQHSFDQFVSGVQWCPLARLKRHLFDAALVFVQETDPQILAQHNELENQIRVRVEDSIRVWFRGQGLAWNATSLLARPSQPPSPMLTITAERLYKSVTREVVSYVALHFFPLLLGACFLILILLGLLSNGGYVLGSFVAILASIWMLAVMISLIASPTSGPFDDKIPIPTRLLRTLFDQPRSEQIKSRIKRDLANKAEEESRQMRARYAVWVDTLMRESIESIDWTYYGYSK